jgi:cytochrome c oxidase subunit 2
VANDGSNFGAKRLLVSISAFALLPALARAQDDPKLHAVANMFDPKSTPALLIHEASILVLLICAAIFVVVAGLLTYTIFRFRRRPGDDATKEPPQVYGSTQIELAWTVLPILITVVLILVTARTIADIQNARLPESTLVIKVIGHQWWWEVQYLDKSGKTIFTTANEIHIPLSTDADPRPTRVVLQSADVIHSFWVPQLNGKTDVIPNRTNELWLEPFETGLFLGNCAEYCGTQHANMLIRVFVTEPDTYAAWADNQLAENTPPPTTDTDAELGRHLFASNACINCHVVDGSLGTTVFGPDLTKLATRTTIAGGSIPNTPDNLFDWIKDPQAKHMKPGALMPAMQLVDSDIHKIVSYLETLR